MHPRRRGAAAAADHLVVSPTHTSPGHEGDGSLWPSACMALAPHAGQQHRTARGRDEGLPPLHPAPQVCRRRRVTALCCRHRSSLDCWHWHTSTADIAFPCYSRDPLIWCVPEEQIGGHVSTQHGPRATCARAPHSPRSNSHASGHGHHAKGERPSSVSAERCVVMVLAAQAQVRGLAARNGYHGESWGRLTLAIPLHVPSVQLGEMMRGREGEGRKKGRGGGAARPRARGMGYVDMPPHATCGLQDASGNGYQATPRNSPRLNGDYVVLNASTQVPTLDHYSAGGASATAPLVNQGIGPKPLFLRSHGALHRRLCRLWTSTSCWPRHGASRPVGP